MFIRIFLFLAAAAVLALAGTWLWIARAAPQVAPVAEIAANAIFVDKSERRLELLRDGRVIRTYEIALGGNPLDPKRQEGDERTPEGAYIIDFRKSDSAYHMALHINYPNAADRMESARLGVPTGGAIFIHGLPNAYPLSVAPKIDWTKGCIALDNAEIEEIWGLVPDGTPITIVP
jgi:murein L,D-transpeptidase YafK